MLLLLLRHGVAADPVDARDAADAARPLTKEGRRGALRVGQFLAKLGIEPTHALSSRRLRAIETAAALRQTAGGPGAVQTDAMDYHSDWGALAEELAKLPAKATVVAAGHEPSIGAMLGAALGAGRPIPMRKGAMAAVRIRRAGEAGELLWMIGPEELP